MESDSKPKIVVLKPPIPFRNYESQLSLHFNFLKLYESSLPLHQFLVAANSAGATAILTGVCQPPINGDTVFRHMPSLRYIFTASTGTEHIDLNECRRRNIAVGYAGDLYSDDCADLAVALLFDVCRKITSGDRFVRNGLWITQGHYPLGNRLGGKQAGIVGLGNIGIRVATRLVAFGCNVSYTSRKQRQCVSYPFYSDILELATKCDVLVICCALTDKTRHMINKEVLCALGKEGVIINIARGAIVDEEELVKCLVEGTVGGAGLDVFENEPEVPKQLFELDNVVLSNHQGICTPENIKDMYELIKTNFEAFFSGKPLLSSVV